MAMTDVPNRLHAKPFLRMTGNTSLLSRLMHAAIISRAASEKMSIE